MKRIIANNKIELLQQISEFDLTVPERLQGRKTEHCERWSICEWLKVYSHIEFPLILKHRDKPDFYLDCGNQEYGIECTEAILSSYAYAMSLIEKKNKAVLDPSLFKWEKDQKFDKGDVAQKVNHEKLTGPGWVGDAAKKEWSEAMFDVVAGKTDKLRKKGFDKFPSNFLLIYDNLHLMGIDYQKAGKMLEDKLQDYWGTGLVFDSIFIQKSNCLLQIEDQCRDRH